MEHLRAFANSFTSAARDMTNDFQYNPASTGRQYRIGNKVLKEERLLSEGGFGFVYLVREVPSGEMYVVKRILCQDRERFELAQREVEILEKLPIHPNLVKYYGHSIEKSDLRNREVSILLEYCPGGHLYDLMLRNNGHVPTGDILKATRDIISGLVALHSMDPPIQHRDLKLENVLLNSIGNYVLLDFGSWSSDAPDLSKLTRDELMRFEETVERYTTLMYRPPEMADLYKGFQISGKVDMWMLGCILFTLLNNKHPFQNASNLAIVNCRYNFDQDHCKNYPPKFIELCGWLLAQNPADRPTSSQLQQLVAVWDESDPLPLPQSVIDRIEKDARLYGIPSMARRNSVKEPRKKSAPTVSNDWTTNQTVGNTTDQWQPDFSSSTSIATFNDLLDLSPAPDVSAPTKPNVIVPATSDSMPDLLG